MRGEHAHIHTHTHTLSLSLFVFSLSLSLTHTRTHTLSHTHAHAHKHTHSLCLLSLSHTHTRTHTLSHTHAHKHTHSVSLSSLSLSHTHTHTHTLFLSLSLTHTHTRTLQPGCSCGRIGLCRHDNAADQLTSGSNCSGRGRSWCDRCSGSLSAGSWLASASPATQQGNHAHLKPLQPPSLERTASKSKKKWKTIVSDSKIGREGGITSEQAWQRRICV